jgi:hypothetical protein
MSSDEESGNPQWPESFSSIKSSVEQKLGISALNFHRRLSGKSGAYVYLVHVTLPSYCGHAIAKFEKRVWRDIPSEADKLALALQRSGKYGEVHFPKIIESYADEDNSFSLFSVAGDGLEYIYPLAAVDGNSMPVVAAAATLLTSWINLGHTRRGAPLTAPDLLNEWLGYRLQPKEGGRVHGFFESCGISAVDKGVLLAGEIFPNPLWFCESTAQPSDLYIIDGPQHCDCHGNNILVQQRHELDSPNLYLIDFALYQDSWPVFYDHAYLELSLLFEMLGVSDVARWLAVLKYSSKRPAQADKKALLPGDASHVEIIRAARLKPQHWVDTIHRSIRVSADAQMILARVAAGLNFANKVGLEAARRHRSIIYAALHLREYYELKNIALPSDAKTLSEPASQVQVSEKYEQDDFDWHKIWSECSDFSAEHIYMLLVGNGLERSKKPGSLGLLRWSMVLDLRDPSQGDHVLGAAKEAAGKHRGFHELTPEQDIEVNFDAGTMWLLCRGTLTRPDTTFADYRTWRFGQVRRIDKQLVRLRAQTSPRHLRVLFLFIDESDRNYFHSVADRIKEVFFERKFKFIVARSAALKPLKIDDDAQEVVCDPLRWIERIDHYFGKSAPGKTYLPRRVDVGSVQRIDREFHGFSAEELLNIREDVELVHPGLGEYVQNDAGTSFLRGSTIAWAELVRGFDVQLEMYPSFEKHVVEKLEAYSNELVELGHEPGAGGTTVSRRLAWNLHRQFPCVILQRLSNSTAERIAQIYHLTHLPVLVIIEASVATVPERERLYKSVRDLHARSVFVYVVRLYNGVMKFQVRSPLSEMESRLFLGRYSQVDENRAANVRRLVEEHELSAFRMPFFFGLFAFEENFTHVGAYVSSHIENIPDEIKNLTRFIALATRFSQAKISRAIIMSMANKESAEFLSMESLFGASLVKLLVQELKSGKVLLRAVHPLIAQEILIQTGPGGGRLTLDITA